MAFRSLEGEYHVMSEVVGMDVLRQHRYEINS